VLTVFTRDNGVLKRVEDIGTQGNGIRNLGKRVSKHGGSIEFGIPKAGHGLTVRMRFEI
jgi:signal transduction histidine kinase